ncbi:MAG: hypothetical protein F6K10_18675, partial [Moorea sp. SIO2B7]|nr:hypothetical protein [Moorena sp. SIO2B7]
STRELATSLNSLNLDGVENPQAARDFIKTTLSQIYDAQQQLLEEKLASFLKTDQSLVASLLYSSAKATENSDYWQSLLTPVSRASGEWQTTVSTLTYSLRLSLLSEKLSLSATELKNIVDYPGAYNLTNLLKLTLEDVRHLSQFKQLVKEFNDVEERFSRYFSLREEAFDNAATRLEALGLSPEENEFLTSDSIGDLAALNQFYGVDISTKDFGGLTDLETFRQQSKLSTAEFTFLQQNQYLVIEEIFIDECTTELKISNLSNQVLDHLSRFITLAHKLDWSFADLSHVLTLNPGTTETIEHIKINDGILKAIAKIKPITERLGLSHQDYDFITTSLVNNPVALGKFYGLAYLSENHLDFLANVETFREQLDLSEKDLENLIVAINQACKSSEPLKIVVDNNPEKSKKISNLTLKKLDVIRRFVFLAQKLNWSFETLAGLLVTDKATDINGDFLLKVSKIKQIQDQYHLQFNLTHYQTLSGLIEQITKVPLTISDIFRVIAISELFQITGWKPKAVFAHLANADKGLDIFNSVQEIIKLKKEIDFSNSTGIKLSFLVKLLELKDLTVEENWQTYKTLAQNLIEITQANYDDETWVKINEEIEIKLNEDKRDALTGFVLWKQKKANLRDLSQHLLMDVETSGIISTSYILQATLSVQQYLHRCRIGLEPGVTKLEIPEIWWQWMMNYRVWEANRKVFLYPENYIDPSLRQNKTPIFKELEEELLQSEITVDSVETAYRNYFEKFAELANLKIVESYRCNVKNNEGNKETEEDTLFLFGRTITEPYIYYYRKCIKPTANKPTWTAWEQIELTINADIIRGCYAFNKLFIFWVETTQIEKKQENSSSTETKATIKYSFQKFNKTWVQAQTLVKDLVIEDYDNNTAGSLWQKVYPLPIPEKNSKEENKKSEEQEKILMIFGNLDKKEDSYNSLARGTTLTIDLLQESKPVTLSKTESHTENFRFGTIRGGQLKLRDTENILYDNYGADSTNSDSGKGLVGYWPLNDKLKDEAGNHHGTFQSEGTTPTWVEAVNLPVNNDKALSLNSTTEENTKLEQAKTKLKQEKTKLEQAQGDEKKEAQEAVDKAEKAVAKAQEAVDKAKNQEEYVELPKASVLKLTDSDFTVEAWVNADELPDRDVSILGTDTTETNEGLHLIIRNKKAYMGFFNNDLEGKTELKPGEWIYLVWRYRKYKAEQAIFINGVKDNFSEGHPAFKGDDPVLIGRWSKGKWDDKSTYFKGQIAEVKIWNKALEDEQIYSNYSKYTTDGDTNQEPTLLTKLSKSHSSVSSVKNQPGWFIFDNGDEAFLATPKDIDIPLISNRDSLLEVQGDNDTINLSYKVDEDTVQLREEQKFSFTRLTTITIRSLSTKLLIGGIDELLSLESQSIPELDFANRFTPSNSVIIPQTSQLDFDGPYGMYFREIFFHIPFLVANTLNANQRFEEAQKWYHYIFNPTAQAENNKLHPSERFWQYLPFRGNSTQKLEQLLTDDQAIAAYNNKPFDPHAIAQMRIGAYEKAIVMKYIDNILDWGDQLFTQDNRESIAQASILYLLAYDLLGEKPESLGKRPTPPPTTVEQIRAQYQASNIPQFLIELENSTHNPQTVTLALSDINTYFCVSENKEFLKYWERVEDRLYKIRHSLSIEGVFRQLALFQPPIDPNQLVRAFAAGGTSATVLSQLSPTVPHYRFDYMLERARNMISTVIQLGSSLLSALEKKDAEELSLLRSTHEQVILQLVTDTKEKQIEEAKETLNSLEKSKGNADERKTHYQKLYDENLNAPEITDLSLRALALLPQYTAISMHGLSVPGHLIPKIFGFSNGGMEPGDAAQAIARAADGTAGMLNQSAGLISTGAQYIRRREEWDLQKNLAEIDVQQIEYQIEAQKIRHKACQKLK